MILTKILVFFFLLNGFYAQAEILCVDLLKVSKFASYSTDEVSLKNLAVFKKTKVKYMNGLRILQNHEAGLSLALSREKLNAISEDKKIPFSLRQDPNKIKEKYKELLAGYSGRIHDFAPEWKRLFWGPFIASKKTAKVLIKTVNDDIGYGVYAQESLKRGGFLGIYSGVVRNLNQDPLQSDYEFNFDLMRNHSELSDVVIDAKDEGNFTRFVSHSYYPNVITTGVFFNGLFYVVFIADEDIKKGEQLFINYGRGYWKHRGLEPTEMNLPKPM